MNGDAATARRSPATKDPYEDHCRGRNLHVPDGIWRELSGPAGAKLKELIYWPDGDGARQNSLGYGLALLEDSIDEPPANLLPLMPIDERSIACAVCLPLEDESSVPVAAPCPVVRWHLGVIPDEHQGALLDSDAAEFLRSMALELPQRPASRARILDEAALYYRNYVEKGKRPRAHEIRPVQLACQNVVIGLAAISQDATFDGLRVWDYVTCDAPHLATHEANRAMAALILCDAFRNGGTMEIRFGAPSREQQVPPALKRFGRTVGVELGREDPRAISPSEARALFLAVTPMNDELCERIFTLMDGGVIAPERLCYTLMAGIWAPAELNYMLATSSRVPAILSGGTQGSEFQSQVAEMETCRAAIMVGTLFRRLANRDAAGGGADGVRLFEDVAAPVQWSVIDDLGAVIVDAPEAPVPWHQTEEVRAGQIIIIPRGLPTPTDADIVRELNRNDPAVPAFVVCPAEMGDLLSDIPILRYPDRLREIDLDIERRLLSMRIGRA